MLKFLNELAAGEVVRSSLKSKQKELANILESEKIVTAYKNRLFLNNGYVFGRLATNSHGAGFLPPQGGKNSADIKIFPADMASARRGDVVIARLQGYKHGRLSAAVVLICERGLEAGVVEVVRIKGVYLGKCFKTGLCHELDASQKSLAALPKGAVLAVSYEEKVRIQKVLGVMSDPAVDEQISLYIYGKREEFDEASLAQARANAGQLDASMYPQRVDLRQLPFCTIDPVHAKDFDDAVYFDAHARKLWVMIADVSEYVSPFSALDKEALRRGFSIYLPHKSIPMLPRELSEGACSLNPFEDKLAFGFCLEYNDAGVLEKANLCEAIICSKRRFNYDEVDNYLQNPSDLGEFNYLYELAKFCQALRKKRLKNGFDFDTAELRMEVENHLYKSSYFERSTPSHQLIEDCMLEANKAAAALLGEEGIFRNHAKANLLKVQQMFGDLEALGVKFKQGKNLHESILNAQEIAREMGIKEEVDKIIIRSFKKADYGHLCCGHYALGFDKYSHFTSPIRRYSDLILHRLLKAKLRGDERLFGFYSTDLEEKCKQVSALEKDGERVATDFINRKFARAAAEQIGQKFAAVLLASEQECSARLLGKMLGARVVLAQVRAPIFSKIEVQICDADLHSGVIFARFIRQLTSEEAANV